ncbi:MFS general substrate transporter [Penicillium brevicompactum]|uniref:MFS general substrate transporter n=1 Tax=Penicillium brevicompactum TaxID=5074 RepID=UPI0025418C83|nr:MFS general substrate transporter [Penicillium brevicompactum]KAJ5325525.1 MFS general substrate transporter [Penicillium brevicompactum]
MDSKKNENFDMGHLSPEKAQHGEAIDISQLPPLLQNLAVEEREALEKRLVRRLDIRLMPMLVLIYILNYLDRNAIAAAKLAGLTEDLELSSVQFQTCVSVLFVGYILMQVPSNLFLNKVGKPALYLPTCMVAWGILCGASGAAQNFGGLVACRFLLGFVEAAYFPGCMVTLSAWYTRKELSLRTAILYCGSLLSGAFSGLIAAAITDNMDGVRGLRAWRWIFIIEGAITVVVAFSAYFVLINFPHNTTGISDTERELAIWRLRKDIGAQDEEPEENLSLVGGFKQCISDWKVWFLVTLVFGATSSGTINSFFPTVVEGLGKDKIQTLLLTVPPYILACIVAMLVSLNADRSGERYFHFTIPLWVSIAGFIISASTTQFGPRYFALMIMLPGVYTAFIIGITWVANTLPRPSAKKAAALAFANAIGNCSSIYSPYLYPSSGAPRFVLAMSVNAATSLLSIITASIFRFLLQRLNKGLDREEVEECDQEGERVQKFRFLL